MSPAFSAATRKSPSSNYRNSRIVDLTLHRPGDHHFIRSISEEGITVVDTLYPNSLVLSASSLLADWPVTSLQELGEEQLQPILETDPEVVILGTGERQAFPPPKLVMKFYEKGIGFEAMTTQAACRTFNVLVSEGRDVTAALIQSRNGSSR